MTKHSIILTDHISGLANYGITDISAAIGIFDGVHAGHRLLLRVLGAAAQKLRSTPVVLTFSPHPREILTPGHAPQLLISPERKAALLEECGVRAIVTIPFTKELAAMSAGDFLLHCMEISSVRFHALCVGSRFRCGAGGAGTTDVLRAFAEQHDLVFQAVPEYQIDGETVCSTAIRQACTDGDLEKVRQFSCRHAELSGYVEYGNGVASSKLEHPTANLHVEYGVLPPFGVYAAAAEFDGSSYPAAVNVGISPTFTDGSSEKPVRTEIHLLDFKGDLYNKKMTVKFYRYLRPEQKFSGPEALLRQINRDVASIRSYFQKESSHV